MKSLRTIIGEILATMTLNKWNYIPATVSRQNVEVDEQDFVNFDGVVLLDPIVLTSLPNKASVDSWNAPIHILFMFKQTDDLDATQDQINAQQEIAKASAKEFFLRLWQYQDPTVNIRAIGAKQMVELDSFLNICLCGVAITCTITINDTTSICLPQ